MAGQVKLKYGVEWSPEFDDLSIELACFRYCLPYDYTSTKEDLPHADLARTIREEGLGAVAHFKRVAKVLFPEFIWHPWADDMLEEACKTSLLGVAGCSHIGKSEFAAIWAIINYLSCPAHTLVLVMSTTLRDAKKRVWAAVERYWHSQRGLPGKLVSSPSPGIRYRNENGKLVDSRGIFLMPGEQSSAADVSSKMQGMKAPRVFLIVDEMSEMADVLLTGALSNLTNNNFFHFSGFFNPKSIYDTAGRFTKPKGGWDSITVLSDFWDTELGGRCLHFDALRSPNWLAQENEWPIVKIEKIAAAIERLGQDTPEFWRMYRGFWCPTGSVNSIYRELEIEQFGNNPKDPVYWTQDPVTVGAFDPSFTSGGDRSVLIIGKYGMAQSGRLTLRFDRHELILEDVTDKTEPRDFQVARKLIAACTAAGIKPEHFAMDATGAGSVFASIVEQLWSPRILRVHFGGAPSDLPVFSHEAKPGKEVYLDRVSELWFAGVDLLRSNQLKNIYPELAAELCLRYYESEKKKIAVESKKDMKARGCDSPDLADAAMVGVALCRERFGMYPGGLTNRIAPNKKVDRSALVSKYNSVYAKTNAYAGAR